jgi:GGDEF domain-containing protein
VSELAERLAQVTEIVRSAALRGGDEAPARSAAEGPAHVTPAAPVERAQDASEAHPRVEREDPGAPAGGRGPQAIGGDAPRSRRVWLPGDDVPDPAAPLWVRALQEEIERSGGSQLSLVLAELEDADRVLAVESESAATFGAFANAVRRSVRRQDILVGETDARAWIIALQTGRSGAEAVGSRISAAVRDSEPWRGAPMIATIGVAVLGDDGVTGSELIDAAERARFEAAASGVDLIRAAPEQAPADR